LVYFADGGGALVGSLSFLDELTDTIQEVRRHLDSIRAEIAALPENQRRDATVAVFSATQDLGDLYEEFAADMLRMLATLGSA
jgi:hypothetical protein